MAARVKYTDAALEEAVRGSVSMNGVCRLLGLSGRSGSAYNHIARRIQRAGIVTDHFLGQAANCGPSHRGGPEKKTPGELLKMYSSGFDVPRTSQLRRALLESGVPHSCAECGQLPEWRGRPLVLEIDHIDGVRKDCRRKNLRFLCPNCHAQTDTFGRKARPV